MACLSKDTKGRPQGGRQRFPEPTGGSRRREQHESSLSSFHTQGREANLARYEMSKHFQKMQARTCIGKLEPHLDSAGTGIVDAQFTASRTADQQILVQGMEASTRHSPGGFECANLSPQSRHRDSPYSGVARPYQVSRMSSVGHSFWAPGTLL